MPTLGRLEAPQYFWAFFFLILFLWFCYSGAMEAFLSWVESIGEWGYLVIILLFMFNGLPFVPTGYSIFGLSAGFIYPDHFLKASLAVGIGTFLGSCLGFWVTRLVFKEWVQQRIAKKPTLQAFILAMEKLGFKLVLMMRMAPIPFGIQNGLFSVSNIPFDSFIVATILGVTPEILMLVFAGRTMASISEIATGRYHLSFEQYLILGVEVMITIFLLAAIGYFSRKAMREVKFKQRLNEIDRKSDIESRYQAVTI